MWFQYIIAVLVELENITLPVDVQGSCVRDACQRVSSNLCALTEAEHKDVTVRAGMDVIVDRTFVHLTGLFSRSAGRASTVLTTATTATTAASWRCMKKSGGGGCAVFAGVLV